MPPKLSVVLGTYNRLTLLTACIESIFRETKSSVQVFVTDAGSTDGTIEYLRETASERLIPIFEGVRLGQAAAYNKVFLERVDTPFVCWLSDDNLVVDGGLDAALAALEADPTLGMVALKVRDIEGPFTSHPYIGGISSTGILNVNQGMLPTRVMRELGGFSLEFKDYGIDPDLTARTLFAGYGVAYTKRVALHHRRGWPGNGADEAAIRHRRRLSRSIRLYNRLYAEKDPPDLCWSLKRAACRLLTPVTGRLFSPSRARTFQNIMSSRYISLLDPLRQINKPHHLVQRYKPGAVAPAVVRGVHRVQRRLEILETRRRYDDHAFASGKVYPRPAAGFSLAGLVFSFLTSLRDRAAVAGVWKTFTGQATIGHGVRLGVKARLINLAGDRAAVVIGDHSVCRGIIRVEPGGQVVIGNNVYISDDVIISAACRVVIDDDTLIAHGVQIFDNTTHPFDPAQRKNHFLKMLGLYPGNDFDIPSAPLHIGRNCWLGMGSMILKGGAVGDRSIVGAGTVVAKPVPADSLIVGAEPRVRPLRPAADQDDARDTEES
ncbi:MAG: glycosyltransferase [Thermodesulfobacteriota bacterium]